MYQTFRFANKPGINPGKPIHIGAGASINDLKHVARIDARQNGVKLDFRKLTKAGATLVIGACESGQPAAGRFEQHGRTVTFRMGGAF